MVVYISQYSWSQIDVRVCMVFHCDNKHNKVYHNVPRQNPSFIKDMYLNMIVDTKAHRLDIFKMLACGNVYNIVNYNDPRIPLLLYHIMVAIFSSVVAIFLSKVHPYYVCLHSIQHSIRNVIITERLVHKNSCCKNKEYVKYILF